MIVGTLRPGKSIHTVPLMFLAPRSLNCCVNISDPNVCTNTFYRLRVRTPWPRCHLTFSSEQGEVLISHFLHTLSFVGTNEICLLYRHVFTGVLKYAYELLTLDTFMKLPGDLQVVFLLLNWQEKPFSMTCHSLVLFGGPVQLMIVFIASN